jgi:hypothetical protein
VLLAYHLRRCRRCCCHPCDLGPCGLYASQHDACTVVTTKGVADRASSSWVGRGGEQGLCVRASTRPWALLSFSQHGACVVQNHGSLGVGVSGCEVC